jgi:hypothetical protein
LKLTGDDWIKGFMTRLIHISHSQWLFWNFTLHRNLKERAKVALRIEVLSHTDPDRIPEPSRLLLEIDTEQLAWSDFDTQSYWVAAAMKAACGAAMVAVTGRLCLEPSRFMNPLDRRWERSSMPGTALHQDTGAREWKHTTHTATWSHPGSQD